MKTKNIFALINKSAVVILLLAVVFVGVVVIADMSDYYFRLNLIYNTWIFAIVAGAMESFNETRHRQLFQYSFGVTRKEAFRQYLQRVFTTFLVVLLIALVCTIAFYLSIDSPINLLDFWNQQSLFFLIAMYFLSCFGFYLLGYMKIPDKIIMPIVAILYIGLFLLRSLSIVYMGFVILVIDVCLFVVSIKYTYYKQFSKMGK